MKASTLLAMAISLASSAYASDCSYVDGNYYCDETLKFIYNNVGFAGSYSDITAMDETTGVCTSETVSFSGTLSPFDQELSVHFRGPLNLKQFGVYYPSTSSSSKRDEVPVAAKRDEDCVDVQHVMHKHVKRATAVVTKTILLDQNGSVVNAETSTTSSVSPSTSDVKATSSKSSSGKASSTTSKSSSSSSSAASSGDWVRASYYTPGSTTNCTFMNNFGASGVSGIWSSTFGNSLSYANSDNTGASSSAVALDDVTIDSNSEFVIFSGLSCDDDSATQSCGFYRSSPAYHGWNGVEKLFVFEFEMPSTSDSGFNGDMPAIWMLNAKIPRTLQYGDASCSCWTTGCGELDLFEILSTGSDKLITHLHDQQGAVGGYGGGGSSDYITRPTTSTMKAVVIFTDGAIHVMTVDDSVSFDSVLTSSVVDAWVATSGTEINISL